MSPYFPLGDVDSDGHQHAGCFTEECRQKIGQKLDRAAVPGVVVGAALVAPELGIGALLRTGWTALVGWALGNAPQIQNTAASLAEGMTPGASPGSMGSLTLGAVSRLSSAEISTGERLAVQNGLQLSESAHVGAEYVDSAGRTYDAMGQPAAYAHWNFGQFTNSIVDHLNKSVDYVALDLKGASQEQAGAITSFVGNLSKAAQDRIKYVR